MTHSKRSIATTTTIAALTCLAAVGCSDSSTSGAYGGKQVCIDQYATATVINDLLDGIKSGLAGAEAEGLNVSVHNPNTDAATEQTLAQKFISDGCDVIVPVGTAASQLMVTAVKDIPVVFAASSTPVESKLVASMDAPGRNVTGVADVINPVPDIDTMKRLLPKFETVGLVWKIGDPAGDAQAKKVKAHLDELGVKYIAATITNGSEITQATESLVGRVDAIEIPGDTTTISAIGGLMKVADDARIPVYGGTSTVVEAGGVLSSTYNYEIVGTEVARAVLQVLDGANPGDVPVSVPETSGFDLNLTKLEKLGIAVPADLKTSAVTTY